MNFKQYAFLEYYLPLIDVLSYSFYVLNQFRVVYVMVDRNIKCIRQIQVIQIKYNLVYIAQT